jgi:hypothetical protein
VNWPARPATSASRSPRPSRPSRSFLVGNLTETRVAKNRVHVDLVADDRDAEIARLLDLGASTLADHDEYGHTWTVLQDPEGNEFRLAQAP